MVIMGEGTSIMDNPQASWFWSLEWRWPCWLGGSGKQWELERQDRSGPVVSQGTSPAVTPVSSNDHAQ